MRADICQPSDSEAIARFQAALRLSGAVLVEQHQSALGVDLYLYQIGVDKLTVFSDSWSIDIEGPPELVEQIVATSRIA
jgi:hypothetical protein